jgi:hypothetical protein
MQLVSHRSVCYVASGQPLIAQDASFSAFLPTDEALFAFETEDEALAAVGTVVGDFDRRSRATRRMEDYFDANIMLLSLLDRVGVSA